MTLKRVMEDGWSDITFYDKRLSGPPKATRVRTPVAVTPARNALVH